MDKPMPHADYQRPRDMWVARLEFARSLIRSLAHDLEAPYYVALAYRIGQQFQKILALAIIQSSLRIFEHMLDTN